MPTGNNETRQFYYEINGELKPLEIGDNLDISLEDCQEIVQDAGNAINNPEYFKGGEITFKTSRKSCKKWKKVMQSVIPAYFTNNWRKMHHLPMVRRRGKRK